MKLSKIHKEVLEEAKGNRYKYGCVMLYLDVDSKWWDNIQSDIDGEDIYYGTEDDPGYGIENEPHITVLFGLHNDIPDEDIEDLIGKMVSPEITLKKIGMFDNADKGFDVVKFDVEGEDLFKMNKMFTELPHTTDYPDYHPHTTIAYVKAGTGEKYAKTLSDKDALTLKPDKIVYSKSDGSKKEYSFK